MPKFLVGILLLLGLVKYQGKSADSEAAGLLASAVAVKTHQVVVPDKKPAPEPDVNPATPPPNPALDPKTGIDAWMQKHAKRCRQCGGEGAICVTAYEELCRQFKAAASVGWHLKMSDGTWYWEDPKAPKTKVKAQSGPAPGLGHWELRRFGPAIRSTWMDDATLGYPARMYEPPAETSETKSTTSYRYDRAKTDAVSRFHDTRGSNCRGGRCRF